MPSNNEIKVEIVALLDAESGGLLNEKELLKSLEKDLKVGLEKIEKKLSRSKSKVKTHLNVQVMLPRSIKIDEAKLKALLKKKGESLAKRLKLKVSVNLDFSTLTLREIDAALKPLIEKVKKRIASRGIGVSLPVDAHIAGTGSARESTSSTKSADFVGGTSTSDINTLPKSLLAAMQTELRKLRKSIDKDARNQQGNPQRLKELDEDLERIASKLTLVDRSIRSLDKLDANQKQLVGRALQSVGGEDFKKLSRELIGSNLDALKAQTSISKEDLNKARVSGSAADVSKAEKELSELTRAIETLTRELKTDTRRHRAALGGRGITSSDELDSAQFRAGRAEIKRQLLVAEDKGDSEEVRRLQAIDKGIAKQTAQDRALSDTELKRFKSARDRLSSKGINLPQSSTVTPSRLKALEFLSKDPETLRRTSELLRKQAGAFQSTDGKEAKASPTDKLIYKAVRSIANDMEDVGGDADDFRRAVDKLSNVINRQNITGGDAGRVKLANTSTGLGLQTQGLTQTEADRNVRFARDFETFQNRTLTDPQANRLSRVDSERELANNAKMLSLMEKAKARDIKDSAVFDRMFKSISDQNVLLKKNLKADTRRHRAALGGRRVESSDELSSAQFRAGRADIKRQIILAEDKGDSEEVRRLQAIDKGIAKQTAQDRALSDTELKRFKSARDRLSSKGINLPQSSTVTPSRLKALEFLSKDPETLRRTSELLRKQAGAFQSTDGREAKASPTDKLIYKAVSSIARDMEDVGGDADDFRRAVDKLSRAINKQNITGGDAGRVRLANAATGLGLQTEGLTQTEADRNLRFARDFETFQNRKLNDPQADRLSRVDAERALANNAKMLSLMQNAKARDIKDSAVFDRTYKSISDQNVILKKNLKADKTIAEILKEDKAAFENTSKHLQGELAALSARGSGKDSGITARDVEDAKHIKSGLDGLNKSLRDSSRTLLNNIQVMEDEASIRRHKGIPEITADINKLRELRSQLGWTEQQIKELGKASAQASQEVEGRHRVHQRETKGLGGSAASQGQASLLLSQFARLSLGFAALGTVTTGFYLLGEQLLVLDDNLRSIQAAALTTSDSMERIRTSILDVATSTKFSVGEISEAAKILVQADVSIEDLPDTVRATALFGAATDSDLSVSADILSTFRQVFSEFSDVEIANLLTKTINLAKLTSDELKVILGISTQVAKDMGLSGEQFLSAVVVLRNQGLKASTAATGLRQALLDLFSPNTNTLKTLVAQYQKIGENLSSQEVFQRFSGFRTDAKPLIAIIRELKRLGFSGSGSDQFSRFINVRSINALRPLVNNLDELSRREFELPFGESALQASNIQMQSLLASAQNLGAALTSVSDDAFRPMIEGLAGAAREATGVLGRLKELNAVEVGHGRGGIGSVFGLGALGGVAASAVKSKTIVGKVGQIIGGTAAGFGLGAATVGKDDGDVIDIDPKQIAAAISVAISLYGLIKAFKPLQESIKDFSNAKNAAKGVAGAASTLGKGLKLLARGLGIAVSAVLGAVAVYEFFKPVDAAERAKKLATSIQNNDTRLAERRESLLQLLGLEGATIAKSIRDLTEAQQTLTKLIDGEVTGDVKGEELVGLIQGVIDAGLDGASVQYRELADVIAKANPTFDKTQIGDAIINLTGKLGEVKQGVEANVNNLTNELKTIANNIAEGIPVTAAQEALHKAFIEMQTGEAELFNQLLNIRGTTTEQYVAATNRLIELAREHGRKALEADQKLVNKSKELIEEHVSALGDAVADMATIDTSKLEASLNQLVSGLVGLGDSTELIAIEYNSAVVRSAEQARKNARDQLRKINASLLINARHGLGDEDALKGERDKQLKVVKDSGNVIKAKSRLLTGRNVDSDVAAIRDREKASLVSKIQKAQEAGIKSIRKLDDTVASRAATLENLPENIQKAFKDTEVSDADVRELIVASTGITKITTEGIKELRDSQKFAEDIILASKGKSVADLGVVETVVEDADAINKAIAKAKTVEFGDVAHVIESTSSESNKIIALLAKARADQLKEEERKETEKALKDPNILYAGDEEFFKKELALNQRLKLADKAKESALKLWEAQVNNAIDARDEAERVFKDQKEAGAAFEDQAESKKKVIALDKQIEHLTSRKAEILADAVKKATARAKKPAASSAAKGKTQKQLDREAETQRKKAIQLEIDKATAQKKIIREKLAQLALEHDITGNIAKTRELTKQGIAVDKQLHDLKELKKDARSGSTPSTFNEKLPTDTARQKSVRAVIADQQAKLSKVSLERRKDGNLKGLQILPKSVEQAVKELQKGNKIIDEQLAIDHVGIDKAAIMDERIAKIVDIANQISADVINTLPHTAAGQAILLLDQLKQDNEQPYVADAFIGFATDLPSLITDSLRQAIDGGEGFKWTTLRDAIRTSLSDVFYGFAERIGQKMIEGGLRKLLDTMNINTGLLDGIEKEKMNATLGLTSSIDNLRKFLEGKPITETTDAQGNPESTPGFFSGIGKIIKGDVSGGIKDIGSIFSSDKKPGLPETSVEDVLGSTVEGIEGLGRAADSVAVDKLPSFGDSLGGLLEGLGSSLGSLLKGGGDMLGSAIEGIGSLFNFGGFSEGTSRFGKVRKGSNSSVDSVRGLAFDGRKMGDVLLAPGESVITAGATEAIGERQIDAWNNNDFTKDTVSYGHAERFSGGVASYALQSPASSVVGDSNLASRVTAPNPMVNNNLSVATPSVTIPPAPAPEVVINNLIDEGSIEQAILTQGGKQAVTEIFNELNAR